MYGQCVRVCGGQMDEKDMLLLLFGIDDQPTHGYIRPRTSTHPAIYDNNLPMTTLHLHQRTHLSSSVGAPMGRDLAQRTL